MHATIGTTDSSTLPIHPTTGLRALAIGRRGPVWPVLGGSGEGDGNTGNVEPDDTNDDEGTTGDQGAGGTDSGQDKGTQKDTDAAKAAEAKEVKDLPTWAQKIVREARKEAADTRGKASASETKLQKQLDGIAVALGLKKGEEIDPAKVQEQLTGERDAAATERDDARRELAIFKAADKHGADPSALLDSREFLKAVGELDATDKDYGKDLVALIKERVKDNPTRYGRTPAKPAKSGSSEGMNGGAPSGPRSTSLHAALAKRHTTQT